MSQERPASEVEAEREAEADEPDAEGHSMLTYELGRTMEQERRRQADRASKDASRPVTRPRRSVIDRLRGR